MGYGVVKRWFDDRGFGFIEQDEGGELFVHHSGIAGLGRKTLREGQRVRFDIENGPKGPKAIDVAPVTEEAEDYRCRYRL